MAHKTSSERLAAALELARQQRRVRLTEPIPIDPHAAPPLPSTIALSREAGANGHAIARAAGERLGWAVYDRELVTLLAEHMGVGTELLEDLDEKRANWLRECLQGFRTSHTPGQSSYIHVLVKVLLALAAHGQCVIVGRGAAQVLPLTSTLRVRLIAPEPERIAAVGQSLHLARGEAEQWVRKTDRERNDFVREHFHKDPGDPHGYDLILNSARYSVGAAAELIVEALRRLVECHTAASETGAGPALQNA
jgi:cytidylate kinase